MILILPDFFELPLNIAITRSNALLDVTYRQGFERGTFKFYGWDKKKLLYLPHSDFSQVHYCSEYFLQSQACLEFQGNVLFFRSMGPPVVTPWKIPELVFFPCRSDRLCPCNMDNGWRQRTQTSSHYYRLMVEKYSEKVKKRLFQ